MVDCLKTMKVIFEVIDFVAISVCCLLYSKRSSHTQYLSVFTSFHVCDLLYRNCRELSIGKNNSTYGRSLNS